MTESCRLYLITPERVDPGPFADTLALALDAGNVACVQLRLKGIDDDAIREAARTLAPVAQSRDVAFLLNDRPDLAAETGCDGVHVGQQDSSYEEARAAVGDDSIVGITCHDSRHFAMVAAEKGADYVAFGAFYATATKDAIGHPDAQILSWWSEMMTVPSVAIGGITAANCAPLVKAGADFIAVLSAVWSHADGPGVAVKAFNKTITEAQAISA
ncbi:MAG: thiamine phosphate synthase [Alphaproteobacteria bacterium]|nr:thiamine phosphate synthase [Alphaproteobacteria bacterium]MCZ6741671.1 thiamine phosphate synthase [Alphaproteobacteria bacterium]MCZ6848065.1 thiamine phosphate synthase [Alphaproteobacteria bacterium]